MTNYFLLGLAIFFAAHSIRIFADPWRTTMINRFGPLPWQVMVALVSLIGFGLLVWGYGGMRGSPTVLWLPPVWTRHLATVVTLPAFILIVAAYVPGNRLKAGIGHPMLAGVQLWALAHLVANGNLADVLLFGSFLVWAALSFNASCRRDRLEGRTYPTGPALRTIIVFAVGIAAWVLFACSLHGILIGVETFALTAN